MILVAHPVGNQNVRALLRALNQRQLLHSFHTSLALHKESFLCRLPVVGKECLRRTFDQVDGALLHSYPRYDVPRVICDKLKWYRLTRRNTGIFCPENVYHHIDQASAGFLYNTPRKPSQVYGYDGKCLGLFSAARDIGDITLNYEAAFGSIAYACRMLEHEREANPAWRASIPDISDDTVRKQTAELALADRIIVASTFAKRTLGEHGVAPGKVAITPYGAPAPMVRHEASARPGARLKVIYVGALTQQKGISYFFDALNLAASSVALDVTVIGGDYANGRNPVLNAELKKYQWFSSASHDDVIRHLLEADILVLPSVAEAFGLVVGEALSTGTAVIVSQNCGAADLVVEGFNGYVVPIRSAEAIASRLVELAEDKDKLRALQHNAVLSAGGTTWDSYAREVMDAILGHS
ncbi:glycosyltransferase family 4 protein [Pseudomonas sp. MAFF 301514]|uniref:Glycosyltransferase family 4 protein n=1 Tax=Pseudomonas allii TaxID=2740531 RepID=A0A7Y8RQZ0_9PSED|nr:glycosyltransferase family 4 protein [Pseudomonas allii]NWN46558.1 glycosyltransferase family 4 protein [Pseudomonas allii]NWN63567.1 glycosyltransferase family 4 protein [Pseudomonas allii]